MNELTNILTFVAQQNNKISGFMNDQHDLTEWLITAVKEQTELLKKMNATVKELDTEVYSLKKELRRNSCCRNN